MVKPTQIVVSGMIMIVNLPSWSSFDTGAPPVDDIETFQGVARVEILGPDSSIAGLPYVVELRLTNVAPKVEKLATNLDRPLTPQEALRRAEQRSTLAYMLSNDLRLTIFDVLSDHPLPVVVKTADRDDPLWVGSPEISPSAFWSKRPKFRDRSMDPGVHRPMLDFESGQTRSFFLDMSPWLSDLEQGEYSVIASVYTGPGSSTAWESEPHTVRVVGTAGLIPDRFAQTLPELPRGGHIAPGSLWLDLEINVDELQRELPPSAFSSLAPYLFLNVCARSGLVATAPLDLLDLFPPHLGTFSLVLRYEVLRARGMDDEAHELRDDAIRQWPGIVWQLDQIEQGEGLIQLAIRRVAKNQPENDQDDRDKP